MNPSRPRAVPQTRHELDDFCAATDASPAVGSAARLAKPLPLGGPRTLHDVPGGGLAYATLDSPHAVEGGGFSDVHPGLAGGPIWGSQACLNFVASGHEPGSQAVRDGAESFPSVVRRLSHAQQHEVFSVRQAEEVYPNPGEVCRERG